MICLYQRTIKRPVEIKGIGLHTGLPVKMRLLPAGEHEGINFLRNGEIIPAKVEYANGFAFSTTLEKSGIKVKTVEHLLAALYLTGIDNVYIEIDNEEVPILDGSAKPFVEAVKSAGIQALNEEKLYAVITKKVKAGSWDRYVEGRPANSFIITYHASYDNDIIGNKAFTFEIENRKDYLEILSSRTYCFLEEVEYLRQNGLAKGGSLENAVVIDGKNGCVVNPEGFRVKDEPIKHKALDLIGDLYLLGHPVIGEIYSYKGGHRLNAEFVKALKEQNGYELKYASEVLSTINENQCLDFLSKVSIR